jgi:hypothetical protein
MSGSIATPGGVDAGQCGVIADRSVVVGGRSRDLLSQSDLNERVSRANNRWSTTAMARYTCIASHGGVDAVGVAADAVDGDVTRGPSSVHASTTDVNAVRRCVAARLRSAVGRDAVSRVPRAKIFE